MYGERVGLPEEREVGDGGGRGLCGAWNGVWGEMWEDVWAGGCCGWCLDGVWWAGIGTRSCG